MPKHHWQSKDGVPDWVVPQPGDRVRAGNLDGQVRSVDPSTVSIWWMRGFEVIATQGVPLDQFETIPCSVNMCKIEVVKDV